MSKQTWFITGAGSGIGHALAEHLLESGTNVALTGRHVVSMRELQDRFPETAITLQLDVTRPDQRVSAVAAALDRFGAIDVLVNNAAIDFVGAIEEQDEDDYRRLFEVNFFGAVGMVRAVLLTMRARRSGTIVNISSMDGLASLPANGMYSASKFALEGMTEALWQEIEPLGLRAIIVQPGSFRTGIEQRTFVSGTAIDDYATTAGQFRQMIGSLTPEMFPGDPQRAAVAIKAVVDSDQDRHWVVSGSDAQRRIRVKLDLLNREFEEGESAAGTTDFPGQSVDPVL